MRKNLKHRLISSTHISTHLRCEYLTAPLAVDEAQPRLSWEMVDRRQGAVQGAYRVLASDNPQSLCSDTGNLWDSGRVEGEQSLHVKYCGKNLKSYQQIFWKVQTWNEQGHVGEWSKPASFSMGILNRKEWRGKMIGHYLGQTKSSPLLRKEFSVSKRVKRALLHVTARGLYHITLNNRKITEDLLAPGWTDFNKRMHYRCYDLTSFIKKREQHCFGAELGLGWYKGRIIEEHQGRAYGQRIGLLAQIRVEYADGSFDEVVTDESWKTTFGPTRQSDFFDGEFYDAQLEPKGWNLVGYDDDHWESVVVHKLPISDNIQLDAYPAEPVRVTQEIKPLKLWSVAPGKIIYDFGQNFAGHVRIHIKGKAGCVIHLRFGEMINHDETLYVDNMRSAFSSDTYVMKGLKREVWEPKFTYHGFRYVEVSGCPAPPSLDNLTGIVVGSDTSLVGRFHCSDELINKIYSNALWTQRSNFLEVPTDCPQRDERMGWTGDAQVFIRTAICNMDVAAFFKKWMKDLLDGQEENGAFPNVAPNILAHLRSGDAAWGDAGVVCPWTLYQCYEDENLLASMFPSMKRWVNYLKKTSRGFLRGETHSFGDHLSIEADTPKDVIQTAHFAHAVEITGKAAKVLGKTIDVAELNLLLKKIKTAFNRAYVSKDGRISGDTQTAYLMAIKFNLLSPKKEEMATKYLVEDIKRNKVHISTGFIGTALVMSVLSEKGHLDLAYELVKNTTFPSWGYSVVNGATTIWERWNSWTKEKGPGDVSMNSYSHYAYGAVVEWMFNTMAGIDHRGKGFQNILLQPRPGGGVKYVDASFKSPYGMITSSWRIKGSRIYYKIQIPANSKAYIKLPVDDLSLVKMGRRDITKLGFEINSKNEFILPAGTYNLSWSL
jgi:alpha-L-rhamnosidase